MEIVSRLLLRGESSRFYRDEEGNFWEPRDMGSGTLYVPAPEWAGNINAYLFEGPNILIGTHKKPICDVPELKLGAIPRDGGNLILTDEQKTELLQKEPQAEIFIRPYMMGKDFINRITRWCLWLKGAEPADIRKCPQVLKRIERVREFRLNSDREATRKQADTPMLFSEIRYSTTNYLAIARVSSHKRSYIPIGWLSHEVVPGDGIFMCENSTLYQFGVLSSSVHTAWVSKISGRFGVSFRYSNTIDYNAFPWPELSALPGQPSPYKLMIEKTAQAILDARALFPRSSLADLYDERTMPPELRKAHRQNDEAVMRAYGFTNHYDDERLNSQDIVISLMYMYKELTGCKEYSDSYPNRELCRRFYADEYEEEYEDYENDEEEDDE